MSAAKPEGPLNVVLDTNVYFSAFNNAPRRSIAIWRRAVTREYALLISPAIIRELADVLCMDLAWSESEIIAQLKLVVRVAKIVEP